MKYIFTYQLLPIDSEKLSKIYQLNKRYRDNVDFKSDQEIEIYKSFLPRSNQEHFVFVEDDRVMHLDSEVAKLDEFQMEVNSQKITFNKAQVNFRIVQNFAWASQLKVGRGSDTNLMALVYVYELEEKEYDEICEQSKRFSKCDATEELSLLRQKNANRLPAAYLSKNIYLCPTLPKTAKLIGIFNPTTGVANKSSVFVEESTVDISKGKKRFIDSAKYALVGYRPAQNEFGVTSYDEFQMPIVNLSDNIMYLCNSNNAAFLEDAMLAISSSRGSESKRIGYCGILLQSIGKSDVNKPSAPEYEEMLDALRSRRQEISQLPIVSGLERQNLMRAFASMSKTIMKMQGQLQQLNEQNSQRELEINKFKRRQKILIDAYYEKRLIICEKSHINDHLELRAFYCTLMSKLTEFFLACKVISSEKVKRQDDKIQGGMNLGQKVAKGICALGENILGFIPGVGFAAEIVDKCIEGGFEVANAVYDKRAMVLLKRISRLATNLSEMDELIEETARRLAFCYEKQIRCLTCARKQKGVKRLLAKGALIDDEKNGGVENLAEACAAKIISALHAGIINWEKDKSLAEQMFAAVAFPGKISSKFPLFKKSQLETKEPKQLKKWNSNGLLQKSGVKLPKTSGKELKGAEYYHRDDKKSPLGRPGKYGYRCGCKDDREGLVKLSIFSANKPVNNPVDDLITDTYRCPAKEQLVPM